MKRHWIVRRQLEPRPDGAQRWDRAYQVILQWAMASESTSTTTQPPSSHPQPEADHADSHLRPGVHPTSD
jgi:hypothetical protein